MFCTTCGSELDASAKICVKCGAPNRGYAGKANISVNSVSPRLSGSYSNDKTPSVPRLLMLAGGVVAVVMIIAIIIGGSRTSGSASDTQLEEAASTMAPDEVSTDDTAESEIDDIQPEPSPEPVIENNTVDVTFYVAACNTKAPLYNAIIEIFNGTYTEEGLDGKSSDYSCGTHEDGYVTIEDLEPGDYTLRYSYAEYNKEIVNVTIQDDESYRMILFPVVSAEDDAIVALTWDGDMDLDLCLFNSGTEEYINCNSYVDSAGSGLFMDNDGGFGGELIYVRGFHSDYAQSFYVVDTGAINEDRASSMEQCNVTMAVYTMGGKIYERTAKAGESSAVWYPGYIYDGAIYDIPVAEEYIYDLADYGWARDMK